MHDSGNLACHPRWYRIANLPELPALRPLEEVIVGKGLQASSFPHRKTAHLPWVWVDEVVPILLQVAVIVMLGASSSCTLKRSMNFPLFQFLCFGCRASGNSAAPRGERP